MVIQTCVTRCACWARLSFERLDKLFDPRKSTSLQVNRWAWWIGRKCCQMKKQLYVPLSELSITLEFMVKASDSSQWQSECMNLIVLILFSFETHRGSKYIFGQHDLSFQLLHQRTWFSWESNETTCIMGRHSSKAKSMGSRDSSHGEFNSRLYRSHCYYSYESIEKARYGSEHLQGKNITWMKDTLNNLM